MPLPAASPTILVEIRRAIESGVLARAVRLPLVRRAFLDGVKTIVFR